MLGKHNGKSLATVACSWNVNAPNCLKVLLKLDATVLGPRSPTMHAATVTAMQPATGLDDRCLQELRALQLQQALQKNMTQEQLEISKSKEAQKQKCKKCGAMWNMTRYPKPHKFASCDGDGMAPWHEVGARCEIPTEI